MKQLNLYWLGGGGQPKIPDGKTVTPINDVTILQQCAGVANPTYTTLSEILADSGVLSTIINSTNAIDYLVRSKTFAKSEALVPTMTSNNTPSGECFGSSYRDSSCDYFKAFDNDSSTSWVPASNATNNTVGYNFGTKTKVTKFRMVSRRTTIHTDTFTVQGSDDNFVSDIHDLVSFTQEANSQGGEYDEIKSISGNYKSYRVFCPTVLYLASNYGVQTKEIQFYSENICENATAMSYIGLNNYASNTLLADSTWCEAICNSTYFESVLNVKVPKMTSNTTPSGEVFASFTEISGREWYKAFSGDATGAQGPQTGNAALGYGFTSAVKVYLVQLSYVTAYSQTYSTTLSIQSASSKTGTWNTVSSETISYSTTEGTYKKIISPGDAERFWRYYISNSNYFFFRKAQLYGRADI